MKAKTLDEDEDEDRCFDHSMTTCCYLFSFSVSQYVWLTVIIWLHTLPMSHQDLLIIFSYINKERWVSTGDRKSVV